MKKQISGLLFLLLTLGIVLPTLGIRSEAEAQNEEVTQESQGLATIGRISARSFNAFISDMRTIGKAASNPAFSTMIEGPIRAMLGAELMAKADLNRPLGCVFQATLDMSQPLGLFYVPIDDIDAFKDFLVQKVGMDFKALDDATYASPFGFLTSKDGWTFLCQSREQLDWLRRSPIEEVIGAVEDETIRITLDLSKIFEAYRDVIETAIREGYELGLTQCAGESAEEFEERYEAKMEQLEYLLNVCALLDEASYTARVDSESKSIDLSMKVNVKQGESISSEMLKKQMKAYSIFSGFSEVPGLFRGFGVSIMDDDQKELQKRQMKNAVQELDSFLNWDELKEDESFNEAWILCGQIWEALLSRSESHEGVFLDGVPGNMNLIYAIQLEASSKVREAAEKLTEFVQKKLGDDFEEAWTTKEVSTKNGMKFFQITVPTARIVEQIESEIDDGVAWTDVERELFFRIVGESLSVVIGGKGEICFAGFGNEPLSSIETLSEKTLESVSSEGGKENQIGEIRFDVRRLLDLALSLDNLCVEALEKRLAKAESNASVEEDEENVCQLSRWEGMDLEDILRRTRKGQRTIELLLAILDETENVDATLSAKVNLEGGEVRVNLEEGITQILGMVPSILLFYAM